jgi:cytochrome c553
MRLTGLLAAVTLAAWGAIVMAAAHPQAPATAAVQVAVDSDDIGGVVTGPNGPEAGVWVIAETSDFPTKLRKIVVTDDRGRYLLPDLPRANYQVWVRGYGLVDSRPVSSKPGSQLALTAVPAPNARAAAQYYPANYWYSLLRVPEKDAFPLTVTVPAPANRGGNAGATATRTFQSQDEWVNALKGCIVCHQMGDKATREIPGGLAGLYKTTTEGWEKRLRIGGNTGGFNGVNQMGFDHMVAIYADWTDRIRGGELPEMPARPEGRERNLVLTVWDVGTQTSFVHDIISTDKRTPTLNANGLIFGVDYHNGLLVIADPVKHTNQVVPFPTLDDKRTMGNPAFGAAGNRVQAVPSAYWAPAEFDPRDDASNPNSLTEDELGRAWVASGVSAWENPDFCKDGTLNKYAKQFPIVTNDRHVSMYDPRTKTFKLIPTCFRSHHLNFAYDSDRTLYIEGGQLIGWINTKQYDATGDAVASQGWCAPYFDTNGDGKIDPKVDQRIQGGTYSVQPSPKDGSVWAASPGFPGKLLRMVRGSNPPETCVFEAYNVPYKNPARPDLKGYLPRGIDIDSNGVVWTALAGSSQLASFDRSKCKTLTGPTATGDHCPEGWTLYPFPGPNFKGVTEQTSAEWAYYNWVDKHNTFGMGENIPVVNGTNSDSLLVLDPATGKWTTLRVPYPLSFYQRGLDGRIDDPNTGWKGRGLWAVNGTRTPWHMETGKGQPATMVRFQMRPDPLAR